MNLIPYEPHVVNKQSEIEKTRRYLLFTFLFITYLWHLRTSICLAPDGPLLLGLLGILS